MNTTEIALAVATLLDDKKAEDIVILDVDNLCSYASYLVLASGRSERQVQAMADHIQRDLKAAMGRPLGVEGTQRGRWALVDYGDIIVHLFHQEERYFYDLEGMWAEAERLEFSPTVKGTAKKHA